MPTTLPSSPISNATGDALRATAKTDDFQIFRTRRTFYVLVAVLVLFAVPTLSHAQGLEIGGGWSHVSGDFGTSGFDADTAWWFTHKVTLAANYDSGWNATTLGIFTFTQIGAIAVHSRLQTFVVGPRIFFSTRWTDKHKLNPFGEAQFGFSHLSQEVSQVGQGVSASGTDFSWLLGGGAEYLLSPHWSARANMDLLRTHFASGAQNRFRLVLGVAYTFGSRSARLK